MAKKESKIKQQYNKYKSKFNNYRQDIIKSYNVGYQKGWEDYNNISNSMGARVSASIGYNRGIKTHQRYEKSLSYKKG